MEVPLLELNQIGCVYGDHAVVRGLDLALPPGGLVSLLGASGCGKTTVLRAIAGFVPLTRGEIRVQGQVVAAPGFTMPPERRGVGMVFQDYALFPHLTVGGNVEFGIRNQSAPQRKVAVARLLELVGLGELAARYPHELSGGQQQRVALARALAPNPRLILLDEPFSNLDVELRERLGAEVREILRSSGIAGILVTHDQHEAFAWGEKVGVMAEGVIVQYGTPYRLYHEPLNRFIAGFIGQGSFLPGTAIAHDAIRTEVGIIAGNRAYPWPSGTRVELLLRPDDITLQPDSPVVARVANKAFKGAETLYTLQLQSGRGVLASFPSHLDFAVGESIGIRVAPCHLVAFQAGS